MNIEGIVTGARYFQDVESENSTERSRSHGERMFQKPWT